MIGIERYTVHRAHFHALRGFVVSDAFGAQVRIDFINFVTRADRLIWALGFAYVAIDALVCDI